MTDELKSLAAAVEAAGFFTTYIPDKRLGDRLVCASQGGSGWLGGHSVWFAVRQGHWFVATWTPRIYEIPRAEKVPAVAIDFLTNNEALGYDINADIKHRFGLIEIPSDQFDRLKP